MDKLDHHSDTRKTIIPWYDSESICLSVIVIMIVVFSFGFIGFGVARETANFKTHVWVPIFLMTASGVVILSTGIRLIRRILYRRY